MADERTIAADETADVVARLKRRMIGEALPLWSTIGWDAASGGFIDRLHRDGTADVSVPRRVFVQARQIYCYAKAAQRSTRCSPFSMAICVRLMAVSTKACRSRCRDGRTRTCTCSRR